MHTIKVLLRSRKLVERLEHHLQEKSEKDHLILHHIAKFSLFQGAVWILFYVPIHGEVDLQKLLELYPQKKFVLPKIRDKDLDFYAIQDLRSLKKGKFGLKEPLESFEKIDPSQIDIAFIPGIVFSENGHRIGFGKGFYDRVLENMPCPKVGVAYEFQIVNNSGNEPHDVPMDFIITEKRVIACNEGKKNF